MGSTGDGFENGPRDRSGGGAGDGCAQFAHRAHLRWLGRRDTRTAYPGDMDFWVAAMWTLLPTVLVSLIFFFVLRSIIRADRTERRVYAKIQAEERAKRGLPPVAPGPADG